MSRFRTRETNATLTMAKVLEEGYIFDDSPRDVTNALDIEQAQSGPSEDPAKEPSLGLQECQELPKASPIVHIDPESAQERSEASYTSAKERCGLTAGPRRIFTFYALVT